MAFSGNSSLVADTDGSCSYVHQIDKSSLQCAWVRSSRDCFASGGAKINYASFIYCSAIGDFPGGKVFGVLMLCIWLVTLFIVLATVAEKFFCPALTVVAKLCRLSENVAGVTILAFGNGSPDIFTSLAGLTSGRGELVFSQLIGGGIFVTSVVVGLICVLHPFAMNGMHFLRDCICLVTAYCWTFYVFHTGKIGIYETIGFFVLYAVYVSIVLLTRTVKRRNKLKEIKELPIKTPLPIRNVPKTITIEESVSIIATQNSPNGDDVTTGKPPVITQSDLENLNCDENLQDFLEEPSLPLPWNNLDLAPSISFDVRAEMLNLLPPPPFRLTSTQSNTMLDLALQAEHMMKLSMINEIDQIALELEKRTTKETCNAYKRPAGSFQSFFFEMNPFNFDAWDHQPWHKKMLSIIQIPVTLILKLAIPVVNLTSINHGWCKLLNVLNCVMLPICMILDAGADSETIWLVAVLSGCCLGLCVFLTSEADTVPRYHELFAILGFAGSVWVIYLVANEIVGILRTLGIVMNLSEALLGLTILAWGNSLGDMIANITIAQAGFQKMGFAACFGGPLFGILLGLGISSLYGLLKGNQPITVKEGDFGPISMIFLLTILLSSLVILPTLKFRACRCFGVYLIALYTTFIAIVILAEANIVAKLKM